MLTDLLNRRSFYTSLAELAKNRECRRDKFSLFYIDLDDFKSVNDLYGHDIGDKLLAEVAVRIGSELDQHACMIPDYVSSDGKVKAIFRLGGDEFVAFVNEAEREKVGEIAQKLIDMIKEPYFISNHELDISCSIGISVYKDGSVPADMLLKYADIALYEAKRIHGVYRFHESSHAFIHLNEIRIEGTEEGNRRNRSKSTCRAWLTERKNSRHTGAHALAPSEYGELEASQFLHIAQKSDQIILLGGMSCAKRWLISEGPRSRYETCS